MPIELYDASFGYDDHPIVTDISLRLLEGRTMAIVGPSGSGKSTVLAGIGGLLPPMKGRVDHTVPSQSYMTAMAWVPQGTNLLPHRTALDNVSIGGLSVGMTYRAASERALVALGAMGVHGRADMKGRTLSGGEAQRVCIARALTASPAFILADEPTGQLDHSTTAKVIAFLFESVKSFRTGLVVATHDLELAGRCDEVVQIEDGCLGRVN